MVTPSLPYPPIWGAAMRNYQFLRHLAPRHQVTLLTYADGCRAGDVATVEQLGIAVQTVPLGGQKVVAKRRAQLTTLFSPRSFEAGQYRTEALQRALDRLVATERFDLVQLEQSQLGGLVVRGGPPVVLDEHNVEYEVFARMFQQERAPLRKLFYGSEYLKLRGEERQLWRRVDGCVLTSEREQAILRRHEPRTVTAVVPNGVDVDYFRPDSALPDAERLVFTGLMGYRPNVDAAEWFVREVLPLVLRARPRATLYIVGAYPSAEVQRLAGPNVIVTGAVPDVRPYVARAAVGVVPILAGSGTRLKVLEGLAMGKALVSTTVGCEGIAVRPGEHLLVADAPAAFARQVLQLLDDRELAARLGGQGRALVEREYGWPALVQQLEAFHARLLGAPSVSQSLAALPVGR